MFKSGRVPTSFFFEKPNKTRSFLRNSFQSSLLKHIGEVVLFFKIKKSFKIKKTVKKLDKKIANLGNIAYMQP